MSASQPWNGVAQAWAHGKQGAAAAQLAPTHDARCAGLPATGRPLGAHGRRGHAGAPGGVRTRPCAETVGAIAPGTQIGQDFCAGNQRTDSGTDPAPRTDDCGRSPARRERGQRQPMASMLAWTTAYRTGATGHAPPAAGRQHLATFLFGETVWNLPTFCRFGPDSTHFSTPRRPIVPIRPTFPVRHHQRA